MIPFFTDQNVPDSVGVFLTLSGHSVVRLREVMLTDTADPVIAAACSRNGHVLVSHDGDFRSAAPRLKITHRQYRESLHRIILRCPEPEDVVRLTEALPLIEREWESLKDGRQMIIEVRSRSIITMR